MYQPNYYHGWIGREWTGTNEGFEEYQQIFETQLTELCTRYGKLAELWFDGGFPTEEGLWRYGCDKYPRGPRVEEILAEHQPDAVVVQGPLAQARWSGTESGASWYPAWSTIPDAMAERRERSEESRYQLLGHGIPGEASWIPAQCCTTLNAAPNEDGLIPDEDMQVYERFGVELRRRFGRPVGEKSGTGSEVELRFEERRLFDHVVLMEDIAKGERVREYVVEAEVDGLFGEWQWFELCRGSCIGHKRIHLLEPFESRAVRVRIRESVGEARIRSFALYHVG